VFTRDDLAAVLEIAADYRADFFIAKVDTTPGPVPEHDPDLGPCLLWNAGTEENGYGRFRDGDRRMYAHVWAFTYVVGPVEPGHEVDHRCHHPDYCTPGVCVHRACVNPGHLRQVTRRVNTLRSGSFVARQAAQTHCHHGHEFTAENTITYPSHPRSRKCRTCESGECPECAVRRARTRNKEYTALRAARAAARDARQLAAF
jgi:hypothetical protein